MTLRTDEGLWVRSDRTPGGTYVLSLSLDSDHAWTLTPDQAEQYARACLAATEWAAFDAAVVRLLIERLQLDADTAAAVIVRDLRPDRPTLPVGPGPLTFAPGVTVAPASPS